MLAEVLPCWLRSRSRSLIRWSHFSARQGVGGGVGLNSCQYTTKKAAALCVQLNHVRKFSDPSWSTACHWFLLDLLECSRKQTLRAWNTGCHVKFLCAEKQRKPALRSQASWHESGFFHCHSRNPINYFNKIPNTLECILSASKFMPVACPIEWLTPSTVKM